jgi:ABC-type Fe3+/spermidine/putrescine transport system ATPase subunit
MLTILGKSGCGKSTLLKCIYGLIDLQKGSVIFNGEPVLGPSYNLIPGHAQFKLVSQDSILLENCTVEENIKDQLSGYTNEYKSARTEEVLLAVDLKKHAQKKANQLSSGQRQRLCIARAITEFPKLLLLDEPFSNLDFYRRDKLFTFIRKNLKENNSSCIYVTHHPQEAIRYANEVMIIEEGKITAYGKPEIIYKHPQSLEIARLFGPVYLLDKKLITISNKLHALTNKILIRPEQLYLIKEANAKIPQIKGEVEAYYFSGYRYDIQVRLSNRKLITFTHHESLPEKSKISLGILF